MGECSCICVNMPVLRLAGVHRGAQSSDLIPSRREARSVCICLIRMMCTFRHEQELRRP